MLISCPVRLTTEPPPFSSSLPAAAAVAATTCHLRPCGRRRGAEAVLLGSPGVGARAARFGGMGTPEFPDLGKHCSVGDCNQIDFLPFTCDRCDHVRFLQSLPPRCFRCLIVAMLVYLLRIGLLAGATKFVLRCRLDLL
jgi:hypothetical protein